MESHEKVNVGLQKASVILKDIQSVKRLKSRLRKSELRAAMCIGLDKMPVIIRLKVSMIFCHTKAYRVLQNRTERTFCFLEMSLRA